MDGRCQEMIALDTNVCIRYVTNDYPVLAFL